MKKVLLSTALISTLLLGACSGEEAQPIAKDTKKEETVSSWQDEVKSIAKSDKSETEKYDEVLGLSKEYKPTDSEIKDFETDIVKDFKNNTYLSDIKNHDYMLNNIFKSSVVENYYDDKEMKPIDKFAFDFLQNTKYTYRGVDAPDSESVKSNEEQMNKTLADL